MPYFEYICLYCVALLLGGNVNNLLHVFLCVDNLFPNKEGGVPLSSDITQGVKRNE